MLHQIAWVTTDLNRPFFQYRLIGWVLGQRRIILSPALHYHVLPMFRFELLPDSRQISHDEHLVTMKMHWSIQVYFSSWFQDPGNFIQTISIIRGLPAFAEFLPPMLE
ncbi:MAG TPA: hypothetical protein VJN01_15930 [Xanthomonadales bacterium]|nr:hypothetical protein [Xanthomonadales bacterium]